MFEKLCKLLALSFVVLSLIANSPLAQEGPVALQDGIEIRQVLEVGKGFIRIAKHPVSGEIFYMGISGLIYSVDVATGNNQQLYAKPDHGVGTATGFTIGPDGTFYLVGNPVVDGKNVGIVRRGKMVDGDRIWSTVAETEPYARSGGRDHLFNAIELTPDGQYLLVNSGSRTDHGESARDGREHPITSAIFRLPIDAVDLLLPNDTAGLSPYLFADGVRNSFDMAFAPNGDLFACENSDTRDNPEELNWIRPGHHYGFPWRIAAYDNPQRFADFDPPDSDNLLVDGINMERTFHNDPEFPPPPEAVVFTDPVLSNGPDADKYRDPVDGQIKDASDEGVQISTFTSHSSPLGIVFDSEFALKQDWAGDGFCLSQNAAFRSKYTHFGDPGEDLLHLELSKNADGSNYQVEITRLVRGFTSPIDAVMRGNKIYVLEYIGNDDGNLWEITLPAREVDTAVEERAAVPDDFVVDANFPNPFNASTVISYTLPNSGAVVLRVFDSQGQTVRTLVEAHQPAGQYRVPWDGRDNSGLQVGSGTYFAEVSWANQRKIEKMLLLQ